MRQRKGRPAGPALPEADRLLAALRGVGPLPALAEVGAAAAEQGIGTALAEQIVVTVATPQRVGATTAVDVVARRQRPGRRHPLCQS